MAPPATQSAARKGTCSGCHAVILWLNTAAGKWMPCDPDLLTVYLDVVAGVAASTRTLVTEAGVTVKGRPIPPEEMQHRPHGRAGVEEVRGYVPHWATCPTANRFRETAIFEPDTETAPEARNATLALRLLNEWRHLPVVRIERTDRGWRVVSR